MVETQIQRKDKNDNFPSQVLIVNGKLCSYNKVLEIPTAVKWVYNTPSDNSEYGVIQSNVEILKTLLKKADKPELSEVVTDLEHIFASLPMVGSVLVSRIKDHFLFHNYDPGIVRAYVVGGRVHFRLENDNIIPQPLKLDSDLDIIVAVEKPILDMEFARNLVKECILSDHLNAPPSIEKNIKFVGLSCIAPAIFFEGELKLRSDEPRKFTLPNISKMFNIKDRFQMIGIGAPLPKVKNSIGSYLLIGEIK